MEAAILIHVHPLGPSFRPGGGQALPLPTVNLLTLCSVLLMIALEIHHCTKPLSTIQCNKTLCQDQLVPILLIG